MRSGLLTTLGAALALAALAAPGTATAGAGMVVGAVEDDARAASLVEAETRMGLLRVSGFRAARITSYWQPGRTAPTEAEERVLENAVAAAARNGLRLYVTVMHVNQRTTPLTPEARGEFSSYAAAIARGPGVRHLIVGNEPNLNRFWMPQFALDGGNAAAPAYLQLLAETYDALKAVSPSVRVYGGAVSPRGNDRPGGIRPTHSPTTFIQGLGVAYRAGGRTLPVMDAFVMHPYGDNSSQPPSFPHPKSTNITVADYEKLVALLRDAFDGTAQRGSDLPIVYGEYGVESEIPSGKADLYTGTEPERTRPVSEETQAAYYEQALALAFCQPNVEATLLFLSRDERSRATWQSGVYYVDGTPKSSLSRVTDALDRATGGSIARCPGLSLTVQPTFLRFSGRAAAREGSFRMRLRCNLDCVYRVRFVNAATGRTKAARRGSADVGELVELDLGPRRLARGTYRFVLRLQHPVNKAPATFRESKLIRLP
jgi:hypothetical protein